MSGDYERDLWKWFLARAKHHNVYYYEDVLPKVASHLAECGIDYDNSQLPDVGTVSQFTDTESENDELPAITVAGWICKCGKYGDGIVRGKWPSKDITLAIPGPYPLIQIINEVAREADES
ncbi:hypothetical protein [Microbispora sp. NPDC049125]|uniref:hypothetical protein n=1 Tax=Microbispora sp. NPDC049125 TaxID=3154929 RepID=UPI003467C676